MLDASDGLRFGVVSASVADDVFEEVVEDMVSIYRNWTIMYDQHSTVMKSFFFFVVINIVHCKCTDVR